MKGLLFAGYGQGNGAVVVAEGVACWVNGHHKASLRGRAGESGCTAVGADAFLREIICIALGIEDGDGLAGGVPQNLAAIFQAGLGAVANGGGEFAYNDRGCGDIYLVGTAGAGYGGPKA